MIRSDGESIVSNPSRRELFAGIAAAAAFGYGGCTQAAVSGAPPRFHRLVADDGLEGQAFADEAVGLGASTPVSAAAVGDLWARDLYFQWKLAPAPIAGLTEFHVWFLLDQMAAAAGLRTVCRTHHLPSPAGLTAHEIFGTHEHRSHRTSLYAAGRAWPRAAARLVMAGSPVPPIDHRRSTVVGARELSLPPTTLVSWIIAAPVRT